MSGGDPGSPIIDALVFQRWQSSEAFENALRECAEIISDRTGLTIKIAEAYLSAAHQEWLAECNNWHQNLLPPGTRELNHLKQAAILLHKLISLPVFVVSGEVKQDEDITPPPLRLWSLENRRRVKDGGSWFISWFIVYQICDFFERYRIDLTDLYQPRITADFDDEMISVLMSGQMTSHGIYMTLMALFLRD